MIDFPLPQKHKNVECWMLDVGMLDCWIVGLKNLYVQSYKFISL